MNLYGDKYIPTTGRHGASISEQRIDELDRACLDFVKFIMSKQGRCQVVDVGGGAGAQAKRTALLGASTLLVDLTDQKESIDRFNHHAPADAGRVTFIQCDVREMNDDEWPPEIDCVYSQRMMGCIPYKDLFRLLSKLRDRAANGARFFLSTGGLDAEYGIDYPDRDRVVEDRFCCLSTDMATKHGIFAPECLYRESEFRQLAERVGLSVTKSWSSAFGSPKVIAENLATRREL